MPCYVDADDDGDPVWRYLWPARYVASHEDMDAALRGWRRQVIKDREELNAHQQACGRADRDGAGFFKGEAAHQLKLERACKLMLPWLGVPDAGQVAERPLLWPVDLANELDEISNRILLQWG